MENTILLRRGRQENPEEKIRCIGLHKIVEKERKPLYYRSR
jgi:hypothetical protein